jgi:hypothetical protein
LANSVKENIVEEIILHHNELRQTRPPLKINAKYQYFVGEDGASKIRTGVWRNLYNWYKEHPCARVVALCETEEV